MECPKLKNAETGVIIDIDDNPFTIGRALSCNFVVDQLSVSRVHCVLEKCSQSTWYLRDTSSNGVYINSRLCKLKNSNTIIPLKHNDTLAFTPDKEIYIFLEQPEDPISDEQLTLIADRVELWLGQPSAPEDTTATTIGTSTVISTTPVVPSTTGTTAMLTFSAENSALTNNKTVTIPSNVAPKITTLEKVTVDDQPSSSRVQSKQDQQDNLEEMEDEMQCSICSEMFVKATTLNCSHTFCKFCIETWKKTKSICPICRANITSQTPTLVLDNLIEKVIQNSSDEVKGHRKNVLEDRKKEEEKQPQQNDNRGRHRGRGRGQSRGTLVAVQFHHHQFWLRSDTGNGAHGNIRIHNTIPGHSNNTNLNNRGRGGRGRSNRGNRGNRSNRTNRAETNVNNIPHNIVMDIPIVNVDTSNSSNNDSVIHVPLNTDNVNTRSDPVVINLDSSDSSDTDHDDNWRTTYETIDWPGERRDYCFACGRSGHWYRHCPFNN